MLSLFATLGGKIAIGLLAGGAVVGGSTVAAYADLLPASIQQAAHDSIGAPAPSRNDSAEPTDAPTASPTATPTSTSPVGPDATGPAGFGLCTAFTHGGLNVTSTAYASLASAANGADKIASYCATFRKPGPTATHGPNGGNDPHTKAPSPGSTHKPAPGTHP